MKIKEFQKDYNAPRAKVIEVSMQNVLCQSGGINNMSIDEDGGADFE